MTKTEHMSFVLQTDGVDNYWKWIEGTVLPSLSSSSRDWARGCHPLENYTIDCNSRLVGGARIRQLRVSPGMSLNFGIRLSSVVHSSVF